MLDDNAARILWVDLDKGDFRVEETNRYAAFIGGRGVAGKILFDTVPYDQGPLDPGNALIFSAGVLSGTLAPASGRLSVCNKNVESTGFSFASAGGAFAPEMRYAGIDHIIVTGRANQPVYLLIKDDDVSIRDASPYWGLDAWETEKAIKKNTGIPGLNVAAIGQAGENRVRMAGIIVSRNRVAGWGGCGAVMGSKNLKAIAVKGSGGLQPRNPKKFMETIQKLSKRFDDSEVITLFRKHGSYAGSGGGGMKGIIPVSFNNMEYEYGPPEILAKVNPQVFQEKFEERRLACFGCRIYCSSFYKIKEKNKFGGLGLEAIKTNIYRAFGSNLGIHEPETILKLNDLADRFGLNCDAVSAAMAWAFDIYERGIIGPADTDGLELNWGNGDAAIALITRTALRQGFGDILAEGVYRAALKVGKKSMDYAMHVKQVGMCEQAVRMNKGWALGIMTATIGGGHLCGAPNTEQRRIPPEVGERLFGVPTAGDGSRYEGKGKLVAFFEKYKMLCDMAGTCLFTTHWQDTDLVGQDDFAEMIRHFTGRDISGEELLYDGDRAYNIEKAFNTLHAGFNRSNDYPPRKLIEVPVHDGPYKGAHINLEKWEAMLDEYYDAHGWDRKTGLQTEQGLKGLNLPFVVPALKERGLLPG